MWLECAVCLEMWILWLVAGVMWRVARDEAGGWSDVCGVVCAGVIQCGWWLVDGVMRLVAGVMCVVWCVAGD